MGHMADTDIDITHWHGDGPGRGKQVEPDMWALPIRHGYRGKRKTWFPDTDSLRYSNHAVTKRIKTDLSVRRVPRVSLSKLRRA